MGACLLLLLLFPGSLKVISGVGVGTIPLWLSIGGIGWFEVGGGFSSR